MHIFKHITQHNFIKKFPVRPNLVQFKKKMLFTNAEYLKKKEKCGGSFFFPLFLNTSRKSKIIIIKKYLRNIRYDYERVNVILGPLRKRKYK